MGTVYCRVILTNPRQSWEPSGGYVYDMPRPVQISATQGFGILAGDTTVSWNKNVQYIMSSYTWMKTNAMVWIYLSRNDISTTAYPEWYRIPPVYLINSYFLEEFKESKSAGERRWILRGRDASQFLSNIKVNETIASTDKLEVYDTRGNTRKVTPTAPNIIKYLLQKYAGPTNVGGYSIQFVTTVPSSVFSTKSYTVSDKSLVDCIIDMCSPSFTDSGYYNFRFQPQVIGQTYSTDIEGPPLLFVWSPVGREFSSSNEQYGNDIVISSYLDTVGVSEPISGTYTKIAQKFVTGESKVKVSAVDIWQKGEGSLVGNVRIETNSGGSPSGTLAGTNSYKNSVTLNRIVQTSITLNGLTTLSPNTTYWLVFARTSGTGWFTGNQDGGSTAQVKFYNNPTSTWVDSTLIDFIWHNIYGAVGSSSITEGYAAYNTASIVKLDSSQSYVGKVNMIRVYCGDDPNGDPINAYCADPSALYSKGLKSEVDNSHEDLAKKWIEAWPEPTTWDGNYYTMDGTACVNKNQYVSVCRTKVRAQGYAIGMSILATKGSLAWDLDVAMRGTSQYLVGQIIKLNSVSFGTTSIQRSYVIKSIRHNYDSTGWTTDLSLSEFISGLNTGVG